MESKEPLVSILVSVLNDVKHIEETLLSILSQDYSNKELVVIDAGSTDGTVELIKKYEDEIAFFVSEPDDGIYNGFNKGIQHCTGDWIKILNSGDLFYDAHSIEQMMTVRNQHKDSVRLIYSPIMTISESGKQLERSTKLFFRGSLKLFPSFFHPSWFLHRSVYEQLGGYDETYQISADYEYYWKLCVADIDRIFCEALTFVCFRAGGASSGFQGVLETFIINKKYQGLFKASYVISVHFCFKFASKTKCLLRHFPKKIMQVVAGNKILRFR